MSRILYCAISVLFVSAASFASAVSETKIEDDADPTCSLEVRDQTGGLIEVLSPSRQRCKDAKVACYQRILAGAYRDFQNPYCTRQADRNQNPPLSRRAVKIKDRSFSIRCYFDPTLTSASLGVGYLTGHGWMRCDDGNTGWVTVWGLNFFAAGFSKRERGSNWIGLTGVKAIDGVEGTYHGVGIQASALFVNAEAYLFAGPEGASMYWLVPPMGIEIGALYRTLTLELKRGERWGAPAEAPFVASPQYTAALLALQNLKFELIEVGGKEPALYIATDQNRIPKGMLPIDTASLRLSLSIVRKEGFDATIAHYSPELRGLFLEQPYVNRSLIPDERAVVVSGLEPGVEYCVVARPEEAAGGYPLVMEYCFDYPENPRAWEPFSVSKERIYWD